MGTEQERGQEKEYDHDDSTTTTITSAGQLENALWRNVPFSLKSCQKSLDQITKTQPLPATKISRQKAFARITLVNP